jgi:hypothetical protein
MQIVTALDWLMGSLTTLSFWITVKPCFIAPRFTAKLSYRQEFLQSRFPYVVRDRPFNLKGGGGYGFLFPSS